MEAHLCTSEINKLASRKSLALVTLNGHVLVFFYLLSFLVGHKLDKVGGKAKKSLSSLKLVSRLLYV